MLGGKAHPESRMECGGTDIQETGMECGGG